ncbi:hypothetical protein MTO96_041252 [Rhipicephalus appendiculatus]
MAPKERPHRHQHPTTRACSHPPPGCHTFAEARLADIAVRHGRVAADEECIAAFRSSFFAPFGHFFLQQETPELMHAPVELSRRCKCRYSGHSLPLRQQGVLCRQMILRVPPYHVRLQVRQVDVHLAAVRARLR